MTDPQTALATHLAALRAGRGWTLDQLAERSGVSRATLSRIEKSEVSPTTEVLGRLCTAYDLTMSRVLAMVEDQFRPVQSARDRVTWEDRSTGFRRQVVSGATGGLAGEVLSCHLPAHRHLSYDAPPRAGLEHHLLVQTGALQVTVDGVTHDLRPGDCLRYRLHGGSDFRTGAEAADYLMILI
ncbi:helix-turn-helix domain-containing protein [Thalassovita taeanensis]|uniref:Helix-turn-helix domain-containing protein n=1 Tax=Thalassovita taeanensis TaxID=657014 RepID=A0A1H9CPP6_9RHOB|nr:XRE family transcriptional regulator [Thalassovita taeanensis]SEQ03051.1 Helix-turn-helix domain-containing protein [Thalassovita taeanensis]